jgi:two-component sensor histidine kinase
MPEGSVSIANLSEVSTRYELACRAAGIGVWELHITDGRLEYCPTARAIFGFPPEGPISRDMVYACIHPQDAAVVRAAAQRAMDPTIKSDEHYVYRIRRHDTGDLRWLSGYGIAQFSGEGANARAVLYAGSLRDITDRELTRQAQVRSEEQLRLALDAAEMAVWDVDLETQTVAHSPDLNRMLGFPPEAHPSIEELRSRYAPGERERMEALGASAMARGETSLQTRVNYVVPGKGEVTYVLRAAFAAPVGEQGRPNRVIGVIYDATEQVRAEERLATVNAELRHRLKNMAHLAGLFARQTWKNDPRLDSFLGRIRALTLSADLMFGRHESDLRLHQVVLRTLEPFRADGSPPILIEGPDVNLTEDQFTGLALLLHELATNAVKHGALSSPAGSVGLRWQVTGDVLQLEWVETGGPTVTQPDAEGFGLKLLTRGALPPPHSVLLEFLPDGLVASVRVRLEG